MWLVIFFRKFTNFIDTQTRRPISYWLKVLEFLAFTKKLIIFTAVAEVRHKKKKKEDRNYNLLNKKLIQIFMSLEENFVCGVEFAVDFLVLIKRSD